MSVNNIPPDENGLWHFSHPVSLFDHFRIAMIKTYPGFSSTGRLKHMTGKYLHLGYGNKIIQDTSWTHLDLPDYNAETDKLPYEDETFNGIACYHMLDHLSDPRPCLAECQRVLRIYGWMVIVVPHYASELWHADVDHKSQYAIDTWENIFSTKHYANTGIDWQFRVGFNMTMALAERNTILFTQLIKEPPNGH